MPTMPPSKDELQQSLRRLHAELGASSSVDARSRQLLQEVLTDIERLLHRQSPGMQPATTRQRTDEAADTAPRRLSELAVQFETRHPLLAASARQFVDLLGRAGL